MTLVTDDKYSYYLDLENEFILCLELQDNGEVNIRYVLKIWIEFNLAMYNRILCMFFENCNETSRFR